MKKERVLTNITHRAAVLGDPIAHSLSPVLHNAAYEAMNLQGWFYDRAQVSQDGLDDFLHGLDSAWRGLSLTMPLKRTIIPYGKPQDKWVKLLGVANTAVMDWEMQNSEHPELPGIRLYNTDVRGIQRALQHVSRPHRILRTALILGNGNTARSAYAALSQLNVNSITVAARHTEKSAPMVKLGTTFRINTELASLEDIGGDLSGFDYVVSTLPAHAADGIAERLKPSGKSFGTLLDVIYDPRPTALLEAWAECNGTAIGGEEMLLQQAIPQVAYMTSRPPEEVSSIAEEHMRKALHEAM